MLAAPMLILEQRTGHGDRGDETDVGAFGEQFGEARSKGPKTGECNQIVVNADGGAKHGAGGRISCTGKECSPSVYVHEQPASGRRGSWVEFILGPRANAIGDRHVGDLRCGTPVPVGYSLQLEHLRMIGWQLFAEELIVQWCGHAPHFLVVPHEDGVRAVLVPIFGEAA